MSPDPEFLTVEDVLAIHHSQMKRYGGRPDIRDQKLLESAIGMPQAMFDGKFLHQDFFSMAAAYAFHISQNQPFIDGNKRTGLITALVFLDINNIQVWEENHEFHSAMIAIADGKLSKQEFADLLRSGSV
ncbi:Fic family protein [bacterium]|nr:Fic family protein [bacterium]